MTMSTAETKCAKWRRCNNGLIFQQPFMGRSSSDGPIKRKRLQGFLARNGQPHRVLDCDSDPCAKTLIERFHVDAHHLPIVLCPNGTLLRNPGDNDLARCIGLVRPIDATKV
jgi:hypothetical protein